MKWNRICRLGVAAVAIAFLWIMAGETHSSAQIVIEPTDAAGTQVEKSDDGKCVIDYSGSSNGYVNVLYNSDTSKNVAVQVKGPHDSVYTYVIRKKKYEVLPLTEGDGSYQVQVLLNTEGTSYAFVLTAKFKVTLSDQFQPYIRPNQYIDYNASTQCVTKAESLCKKANTDLKKLKKVYKWVIKYFSYDKQKAKTVKAGYLPDLNEVYKKKKGICFDYAATMTAMLRSQGIPVKLVIGYTGKEYHAWINVYTKKKGWITGAIYIAGNKWKLMDPTFASTGKSSKSVMAYINNTANYSAKYSY